jgi:phosphoribosylformimino-5-aminoimidazole carboxamide ribotide isomerase
MTMLILPAIDIRGGKCVRLAQGDFNQQKTYRDNPIEMAVIWRKQNAKMLHLVDLDAALSGNPENFSTIKKILETVDIPVQVGGGIRKVEDAERYFDIGACRVVIGSAAVTNPDMVADLIKRYGKKKVVIGIDAKDGVPKVHGWLDGASMSDVELGLKMKSLGVERIVYTDITKDGMLAGVGYDAIKNFADKTRLRVTASGGVSSYEDLKKLMELKPFVDSVIIGKALYEGVFPCQKIWRKYEEGMKVDLNFSTAQLRPCVG